jgi:PAS domain S-box-containing protein
MAFPFLREAASPRAACRALRGASIELTARGAEKPPAPPAKRVVARAVRAPLPRATRCSPSPRARPDSEVALVAMTPLAFVALLAIALSFAVATSLLGRRYQQSGYWIWSWVLLIGAGAVLAEAPRGSALWSFGGGLSVLFAALQLAGACERVERRLSPWILVAFCGLALARAAGASAGGDAAIATRLVAITCQLAALGAAASVLLRSDRYPRTLSAGMVALAAAHVIDLWYGWRYGVPVHWLAWALLGAPTFALEIVSSLEHVQRLALADRRARAQAESALDESERRLQALAEHVHDLIAECDERGLPLYFSPSVERALGHTLESCRAGTAPLLHPDDLPMVEQMAPELLQQGGVLQPVRVRRSDGEYRWLEISLSAYRLRDGTRRLVGLARDVTDRIELEASRENARRLESLSVLAGGVAHDFNNLLTSILGNSELASTQLAPDDPSQPLLREVVAASERGAALTQQLLLYAQQAGGTRQCVDAAALIDGWAGELRALVPERLAFEVEIDRGAPQVAIDPAQLRQLVHNLVENAAEACVDFGSRVSVRVGCYSGHTAAATHLVVGSRIAAGGLLIEVADDGSGIDAEKSEAIFDPFYSTRFPGRGLGLAVVHSVVRAHSGSLAVDSAPGRGARFSVYFPAA